MSGWQDEINPEPERLLWTDQEYAQHLAALLHDACSRLEDAGEPITGPLAVWWAERSASACYTMRDGCTADATLPEVRRG